MKNDVYSSTKTSQNADGTTNCKTHFQRCSPTPPFWSQVRPGPRKSSGLWSRRWVSWALEQPKWSPRAPFPSSVAFVSPSSTLNFEISMHLSDFQAFRRSFWSILGLKIGPPMTFFRVLFEKIEVFIYHIFLTILQSKILKICRHNKIDNHWKPLFYLGKTMISKIRRLF